MTSEEYPNKEICGLFGMYLKWKIDSSQKLSVKYPLQAEFELREVTKAIKDKTYEKCLPNDLREDMLNIIGNTYPTYRQGPPEPAIEDLNTRIVNEFAAVFQEEITPGYTPGRETGSNRRI